MNAAKEIIATPLHAGLREATAILADEGTVTYGELTATVNRFGNALRASGVGRQDRVVLVMDDSVEMVAGYLGTMKIGAVAVAISVRSTAPEVLHVIQDSQCKALIIDREFVDLYQDIAGKIDFPLTVIVRAGESGAQTSVSDFLNGHDDELAPEPMAPRDMACWIYTSGTTGAPKGAVHCQKDVKLADLHLRESFGVKPGDRIFNTSKLFFAYALGHSLLGGLRAGAAIILNRGWPNSETIAEAVDKYRPDLLFSVPTMYRNMLRDGVAGRESFSKIRHCVSAGERLPEQLFEQWLEVTGVAILEGIGASEAMHLFIANTASDYRSGSTGKPLPWAELKLLDEEGLEITQPNQPGLLSVSMDSLLDRYWNQPEKTEAAFDGKWYRTGDMFTFDADGWWYHHGRGDEMLKISGQWVSPNEIEETALQMPELADAAVVGVPNAEGLVRTHMFVVTKGRAKPGQELEEDIGVWLRARLSIYKCPRAIRFVDEIPRTPTGKIQRFKLVERIKGEQKATVTG